MDSHNINGPRTTSHQQPVSHANGNMGGHLVTVGCGPSNGRKGNIFTQVASKISQFVKAIFSRPQENRQPVESARFTAQTATRGTSQNRQKKPQMEALLQEIKTSFIKNFPVKSPPTQAFPKKVDHKEGDIVVVKRSDDQWVYGVVTSPSSKLGTHDPEVRFLNAKNEMKGATFDNNIYPLSDDQKKEYNDYHDRTIQSFTDSPRQNAGTLKAKGLADRKEGRAAAEALRNDNREVNTEARHANSAATEALRNENRNRNTEARHARETERKTLRAQAKEQKVIEKAKNQALKAKAAAEKSEKNKAKAKLIKDLTENVKNLQNLFNNTPTAEAMRQEGKAVTDDHDTNRDHLQNQLNAAKEALNKARER